MKKRLKHKWSEFAIVGFILSLLVYTFVFGIIFSSIGLADTSNGKKRGRGLAIAGIVIGIISLFIMIMFYIFLRKIMA
jgi:uncharacterized RDD family membrane protein YckC